MADEINLTDKAKMAAGAVGLIVLIIIAIFSSVTASETPSQSTAYGEKFAIRNSSQIKELYDTPSAFNGQQEGARPLPEYGERADTYTVQEGDTWTSIAGRFGVAPGTLANANDGSLLENPEPGTEVIIPPAQLATEYNPGNFLEASGTAPQDFSLPPMPPAIGGTGNTGDQQEEEQEEGTISIDRVEKTHETQNPSGNHLFLGPSRILFQISVEYTKDIPEGQSKTLRVFDKLSGGIMLRNNQTSFTADISVDPGSGTEVWTYEFVATSDPEVRQVTNLVTVFNPDSGQEVSDVVIIRKGPPPEFTLPRYGPGNLPPAVFPEEENDEFAPDQVNLSETTVRVRNASKNEISFAPENTARTEDEQVYEINIEVDNPSDEPEQFIITPQMTGLSVTEVTGERDDQLLSPERAMSLATEENTITVEPGSHAFSLRAEAVVESEEDPATYQITTEAEEQELNSTAITYIYPR